jgi:hypothetical protein
MPCVAGGDVWRLVGSSGISRWLHKTTGAGSLHGNPKMWPLVGGLPNILVNKVLYNYLSPSLPGCVSWAHEGKQTCAQLTVAHCPAWWRCSVSDSLE